MDFSGRCNRNPLRPRHFTRTGDLQNTEVRFPIAHFTHHLRHEAANRLDPFKGTEKRINQRRIVREQSRQSGVVTTVLYPPEVLDRFLRIQPDSLLFLFLAFFYSSPLSIPRL